MKSNLRPSRTAKKIARLLLLLDHVPRLRGVLPPDFTVIVEPILRSSGAFRAFEIDMMRRPMTLRFYEAAERWLGQGQLLWFALRKRWIADRAEAAREGGVRQIVVVGAGFDPLATGIARRHPEVSCIEIDAPGTAIPKREGIERAGLSVGNLAIVAADLSKVPLLEVLKDNGWRPEQPTFVIAEGVLMYLRPTDVDAFFRSLITAMAAGSRIAFTSVFADANGRPRIGVLDGPMRLALRLSGEPMSWGIEPADLPGFLSPLGAVAVAQPTVDELRATYLDGLGLHEEPVAAYEHLALAEAMVP